MQIELGVIIYTPMTSELLRIHLLLVCLLATFTTIIITTTTYTINTITTIIITVNALLLLLLLLLLPLLVLLLIVIPLLLLWLILTWWPQYEPQMRLPNETKIKWIAFIPITSIIFPQHFFIFATKQSDMYTAIAINFGHLERKYCPTGNDSGLQSEKHFYLMKRRI